MKKLVAGVLTAFVLLSGITAKGYDDAANFDDLAVISDESTEISDVELEVLLRSIIKSELEADASRQNDDEKKIEAEIDKRVNEELKKYRAAGDEYLAQLTKEMEQKTEDEILDIKTNYSLKLAEEKAKMKDEYEGKLEDQRALADLALLEAMNDAESQRLADLAALQSDMELKQDQKENPLEHAELFYSNVNPDDKGRVSIENTKYSYKGKTYNALLYKANTGKPKADWSSWYRADMCGPVVSDSNLGKDLSKANTMKFKVMGDGNWYKIDLFKATDSSYSGYLVTFKTEKGKVQEYTFHRSQFVSYDTKGELDMSFANGFSIEVEYGMEGKARPDANKNYEATFFDFEFVNDTALEQLTASKKVDMLSYASNYFTAYNNIDNSKLYIEDTTYTYEGKSYKGVNFFGNVGTNLDKKINHWYQSIVFGENDEAKKDLIVKYLTKGKTLKFKVLGDGNQYNFAVGYNVNGEYTEWQYRFRTRKGKVTEVKIPLKSLKAWNNKKLDLTQVTQMKFAYDWNIEGAEWNSAPKDNTNFNVTIFDITVF